MAEITGNHVNIYFYDLNEDAQKVIAEAEGFTGLTAQEIEAETNWDTFPILIWDISEDQNTDERG